MSRIKSNCATGILVLALVLSSWFQDICTRPLAPLNSVCGADTSQKWRSWLGNGQLTGVIEIGQPKSIAKMEEKTIKQLKNIIRGHKTYINRLTRQVNELVEAIDEGNAIKLRAAIKYLELRLGALDTVISELITHPEVSDGLIDSAAEYMAGCRTLVGEAEAHLRPFETLARADTSRMGAGSNPLDSTRNPHSSLDSAGSSAAPKAKLPKIPFPTFSGGPTGSRDFRHFMRMFGDLIGENCSPTERVTYFRLGIQGEAEQFIKHIEPTPGNLDLMIETLRLQYKPKEGESRELWGKLMGIQTWKKCNTSPDLLRLIQHVRQHIYLIKDEDPEAYTDHETLVDAIMVLLPEKLMYDITKDIPKTNRTVDRILDAAEKFIVAREEVASYYSGVPKGASGQGSGGPSSQGQGYSSDGGRRGAHFAQASSKSDRRSTPRDSWGSRDQGPNRSSESQVKMGNKGPCIYCKKSEPPHRAHTCWDRPDPEGCRQVLREEKRCFNCLESHMIKNCPRESQCNCGKGKHSPSICFQQGKGLKNWNGKKFNGMVVPKSSGPTFMETAWVWVHNPMNNAWAKARVFLDRGSSDSYCTTNLAKQLGCVPVDKGSISIGTFASKQTKTVSSSLVQLNIVSNLSHHSSTSVELLTMDQMCCSLPTNHLTDSEMRQLAPYPLADFKATQCDTLHVDVLIGMDFLWCFMGDRVEKTGFGPRPVETSLGWVLSGPLAGRKRRGNISAQFIQSYFVKRESVSASDNDLEQLVHKFWDLDTIGIKGEEVSPVIAHFNETVKYNDEGRVEVSIPWKEELKPYLPVNRTQALIRLKSLNNKLSRPENVDLKAKYETVMREQLEDGIIEKVPEQPDSVFVNGQPEPNSLDTNTALIGTNTPGDQVKCYMPHHSVVKRGSTKVRVVFDASCEAYPGALSLNEVIHGGPSLLTDLAETLLHFRVHNTVVIADIKQAYLMLSMNPPDRDAFRFLWYEGEEVVDYRFARVPFGVIVSSFLLNAVLQTHFKSEFEAHPELLELVLASFYVDDFLSGGKDVRSVLELRSAIEKALEKICMKLHGWNSNSEELRKLWNVEVGEDVKVLGLLWDPVQDTLSVNIARVLESASCAPTKKNLLALTASVFDPLGFLQPFLVLPKLMFQQICKSKVGWRGALPQDMITKWETWKQQLADLAELRFPRQVTIPEYERVELHCFCDASELAYAGYIYIKCVYGAEVKVNLVFAKNRIAPLSAHSLPRLELLGAGLVARAAAKVMKMYSHLKFFLRAFYTDSQNVLHWIQSDNRQWATFVLNRVVEVHQLTKPKEWSYVRSERNPSDLATRPISGKDLACSSMWKHGPTFLHDDSIACGDKVTVDQPTIECLAEGKKSVKVTVVKRPPVILDLTKFSSYSKVINITRIVFQFMIMKFGTFGSLSEPCDAKLLHNKAVKYWVKKEQLAFFPNEVEKCVEGEYVGHKVAAVSGMARNLRLFKDSDGLLRSSSRIQSSFSTYDTNNPVILPKESRFTELYITSLHRLLCHAGIAQMLMHIRKFYWIPQGRNKVRAVINRCVACRRVGAKPFPAIAPPPLPDFRVTPSHPFENCGIDTAGPIWYKVGKAKRKGHILLVTCATTRAIALEFITGLSVEKLTMGLRRVFSRYGLPRFINSDNAKSFKRSQKELTTILKSPKMQKYLDDHRIQWKRYVERAAWWGGYIERHVQTVKRSLCKVLGNAVLNFEEYTTVLYDCAAYINSRPLTVIYDNIDEGEPVSPAMLICGRSLVQVPPLYEVKVDGKPPQMCAERLKYLEKLRNYFWTRWSREYTAELREIHSRRKVGNKTRQPTLDEVVLVKNEKLPRGTWKMGRIVKLKPGRDGQVRSVVVRVLKGKKNASRLTKTGRIRKIKHIELNRSPQHLVPLECATEV